MGEEVSYCFPDLRLSEIVSCLAGLQIQCSIDDLTKPQPHRIMSLYEVFLETLVGPPKESEMSFSVMELLEYPQLHNESLVFLNVYRKLLPIMKHMGMSFFCPSDLFRPCPDRVITILSGIINFTKFREMNIAAYEECVLKSDSLSDKKHSIEMKIHEISEKINMIKLKRAEQEPKAESFRRSNLSLTADIKELKKHQVKLNADIETLKKEKQIYSEKMNTNQFLVNNLKQDCSRIGSRIVQNPEKLKQVIAEKTNLAALEKKDRELHGKVEMMNIVELDISSGIKLLDDCMIDFKKYESAKSRLDLDKENVEKKQAELRELNIKEQQMKRQQGNTEEKMTRLKRHFATKKEGYESKLVGLRNDYEKITKERAAIQSKIDSNNSILSEIGNKTDELKRRMDYEDSQLMNDTQLLKNQLDVYQNELLFSS